MSVHLLWHDPGVDRAHYEEVAGLLHGLLIRLDDRLSSEVVEFLDHNELGLALEWMAEALSEGGQPLSAEERSEMLALAHRMEMDDLVPDALASCPAQ